MLGEREGVLFLFLALFPVVPVTGNSGELLD